MWYPVEYPIPSAGYHHNSKQPPRFAKWHAGQDPGGQQAAMVCCVTRATRRMKCCGFESSKSWELKHVEAATMPTQPTRHEMLKLQKIEK